VLHKDAAHIFAVSAALLNMIGDFGWHGVI